MMKAMSSENSEQLAWQAMETGAFDEAVRLLESLAHRNSEWALLSLGWIYEIGATAAPDTDAALSLYARAASQGSAAGCFDLGRLHLVRRDEASARSAFRAGAERGDLPSVAELGRMLLKGHGGPSNAEEGWNLVERAAAQGHFFAQRTLLAIENDNAQSIAEKLSVKLKILKLGLKGVREMWRDSYSDRVR
jgi:TPR repeat protein